MKVRDILVRAAAIAVLGGLAAAGLMLQKPGTEGETSKAGSVAGTSAAWFCPGLMPHKTRTETVAISNPGTESLTGRLTISGDGKALKTRPIDIPALGSLSIDVGREITPNTAPSEITNSQSAGFVAVIELDRPSAAVSSGTAVSTGAITDVAVARCQRSLVQRVMIPGGSSVRGSTTDLFLANPLGHDAVCNISVVTEEGIDEPPKLQRLPVLASSQASYRLSDESRRRWVLDVEANASSGEMAGLVEVVSDGTRIGSGIARVPAVGEGSAAWMFPTFGQSDGESSILSIGNPIAEARKVEVRVVPDESVSPTVEESLRPRLLEIPADSAVTFTAGPGLGSGARFGIAVEASDGRPIFTSATLRPRPPARGLGVSTGQSSGFTRWVLQDPSDLGLPGGSRIVLSIMNVADKQATVQMKAFGSGTVSNPDGLEALKISRGRVATVDVSSLQLPSGVRSIVLDSDTPVVAEATVSSGEDASTAQFDVVALTPMQPERSPANQISRAGFVVPGGQTTIVFAAALLMSFLVVFVLSRRRSDLGRPGYADTGSGLDHEVVLGIAESSRRRASINRGMVNTARPTFILFSHEDCRACRSVRELLDALAAALDAVVVEIAFETDRQTFDSARIEDVPTTVLVGVSRVENVWVGPVKKDDITEALARLDSSPGSVRGRDRI